MSAGSPAVFVALLLMMPAIAMSGGVTGHVDAQLPTAVNAAQSETPTPVNTTLWIALREDGDARWTITANFTLENANQSVAFRDLAEAFQAGETTDLGLSAFKAVAERASIETNRSMTIQNENRSVLLAENDSFGRLRLQFTWTNFGRVDNETLHVGDVFATDWFPGLEPHQQLVVQAPQAYGIVNSEVPPNNGTLRWTGPLTFPRGELSATFTGETAGQQPTTTTPPGESAAVPWLWMGLGIVLIGGVIIIAYGLTRGRPGESRQPTPATEAKTPQEPDETPEGEPESEIDEELLSDEERIERLLERNGGRMKQATIVTETGWSNAKVSQLLSSMDEEGRIDKLRIGRENLISFPDEDVTDLEE